MNSGLLAFPLLVLSCVVLSSACAPSPTTGGEAEGDVDVGGACSDDQDCDSGESCDPCTSLCIVTSDDMDVAEGGDCSDDGDCDADLVCSDKGLCEMDPDASDDGAAGDPCQQDSDCADGLTCDVDTDTCA
jgi:hypothetical protein